MIGYKQMNTVTNEEYEVMKQLFTRYHSLVITMWLEGDYKHTKCSVHSLMTLCNEVINNGQKYPFDKLNRWLGFLQGVLASRGIIEVDIEREITRPLFHSLHTEVIPTFSTSK